MRTSGLILSLVVAIAHGQDAPDVDCSLPALTGRCKGHLVRYYYDSNAATCQTFVYGGCEGNSNNFETLAECQETCSSNTRIFKALKRSVEVEQVRADDQGNDEDNRGTEDAEDKPEEDEDDFSDLEESRKFAGMNLFMNMKVGEVFLILDPEDSIQRDVTDFKDGTFGAWTAQNMAVVEKIMVKSEGGGSGNDEDEQEEQADTDDVEVSNNDGDEEPSESNDNAEDGTSEEESGDEPGSQNDGGDDSDDGSEEGNGEEDEDEDNGSDEGTDANNTGGGEDDGEDEESGSGEETTTIQVAEPTSGTDLGILSRDITITDDMHLALEFTIKIIGYDAELTDTSDKDKNPVFGVAILPADGDKATDVTAVDNTISIFDIRDYGGVFERNDEWLTIKYHFPQDEDVNGKFTLTFLTKRGDTAEKTIYINRLVLTATQRLTAEIAKEMDELAEQEATTPSGNETVTESPPNNNGTSTPMVRSSSSNVAHIILSLVVVVLVITLVIVSIKYWRLKKKMVGTYSVTRSPSSGTCSSTQSAAITGGSSAYDNPAYLSSDRYGSTHE